MYFENKINRQWFTKEDYLKSFLDEDAAINFLYNKKFPNFIDIPQVFLLNDKNF